MLNVGGEHFPGGEIRIQCNNLWNIKVKSYVICIVFWFIGMSVIPSYTYFVMSGAQCVSMWGHSVMCIKLIFVIIVFSSYNLNITTHFAVSLKI